MMRFGIFGYFIKAFGLGALWLAVAGAEGYSEPWQISMQRAVTPVGQQIQDFNTLLLILIVLISVFVLALLAYVVVRFNATRNPTPSKTSHNTVIEVIWTVVPIMILVLIAIPSFKLLYYQERIPEADITVKATGNQWYWSYEYPDQDGLSFDSLMIAEADLEEGQPRLLATDNDVVVPVDTTVRMIITASDVIHAWTVPAFGVKIDAVPGRLNETWFTVTEEGTYYGQCSELCGTNHGFMPISVRVVSQDEYDRWVAEKLAAIRGDESGTQVADASARR